MKKSITVLLTLAMAGTLCACGSISEKVEEKKSKIESNIALGVAKNIDLMTGGDNQEFFENLGKLQQELDAYTPEEFEGAFDSALQKELMNSEDATTVDQDEESVLYAGLDEYFQSAVIADNNTYRIETTDAEWSCDGDYVVHFILENKYNEDLVFELDNASVNGWGIENEEKQEVTAGMKSNESLTISAKELEKYGFNIITNITFRLRVHEKWKSKNIDNKEYVIYPYSVEADQEYKRVPQKTDIVLIDNDDLTFMVTGTETDDEFYRMKICIENKREDVNLRFKFSDVSVDGFMYDEKQIWVGTLPSKVKLLGFVKLNKYQLQAQRINPEDIEEIAFNLLVYDADDYSADNICEETFKIKAK